MSIINEALKKVQDRQEHLRDDDNSAIVPPDKDKFAEQNNTPKPRKYIRWLFIGIVMLVCICAFIGFNILKIKELGLWRRRAVIQVPVEDALVEEPEALQEAVGINEENTAEIIGSDMGEDINARVSEEVAEELPAAVLLELSGIVFGKGGYSTVINDRILEVGDSVAGYRIMSIEDDEVLLVSGERKVVLDLK